MSAHDHQHPAVSRGTRLGDAGHSVGERPQTQLVTADAARLRNPEQAGIDDGGHALGGELAGRVAFARMQTDVGEIAAARRMISS